MASNVDSGSSHESLAYLSNKLGYLDIKDQYKWFGTILLKVEDGGELSEDQAHKMFPFKVDDVIVKWYSTTNTVQMQGAGYASLRESLARIYSSKDELLALHDSVHTTIDHLTAPPDESRSLTANFGPSQESRSIPQSNEVACGACTIIKSD